MQYPLDDVLINPSYLIPGESYYVGNSLPELNEHVDKNIAVSFSKISDKGEALDAKGKAHVLWYPASYRTSAIQALGRKITHNTTHKIWTIDAIGKDSEWFYVVEDDDTKERAVKISREVIASEFTWASSPGFGQPCEIDSATV